MRHKKSDPHEGEYLHLCSGTRVQVDGLEADDGELVVLLVLAVSWQRRIS